VSIAWLLPYLTTHTLGVFVVYRIALGVLALALAATGSIS
jgi:undecaprenyl-diphosphatase